MFVGCFLPRDKAVEEISNAMDISVADIRSNSNDLRAQHGADENYKSSWIFSDRLQFLANAMQPVAIGDNCG